MSEGLFEVLERISIIVGILAFILVALIHPQVAVVRRRRHQRWFRNVCRKGGKRAATLHANLLPHRNTDVDALAFASQGREPNSIPYEHHFHCRRTKLLCPEKLTGFVSELAGRIGKIGRTGCDSVHLFNAGPAVAAATVGAELADPFRAASTRAKAVTTSTLAPSGTSWAGGTTREYMR